MDPLQEEILMDEFRKGSQLAFKRVFDELNEHLVWWCKWSFKLEMEEAEDAVSEAWVKVYKNRGDLKSYEHVKRFVHVVIRNQLIDRHRAEVTKRKAIENYTFLHTEEMEWEGASISKKDELLDNLPELIQRVKGRRGRALRLYFVEQKDTGEIAALMGITRQSALNLKAQGIDQIRQFIENNASLPEIRKSTNSREEEEDLEKAVFAANLPKFLNHVNSKTKRVLSLYFLERKKTQEVAAEMGIPAQSALNLKSQGVATIKAIMAANNSSFPADSENEAEPIVAVPELATVLVEEPRPVFVVSNWQRVTHLEELMKGFKAGERDAFRYVYDLCNRQWFGFCLSLELIEPIEDVLADLWYLIFVKREQFKDFRHVRNYGYVYLRHYSINSAIALRRKERALASVAITRDYPKEWDSKLNYNAIAIHILELLNRSKRAAGAKVLRLQFFYDMSVEDIAERLGISVKAAYKNRSHALEHLKEQLSEQKNWLLC